MLENSDGTDALKASLVEKGFFLTKGDRRGVVAVVPVWPMRYRCEGDRFVVAAIGKAKGAYWVWEHLGMIPALSGCA